MLLRWQKKRNRIMASSLPYTAWMIGSSSRKVQKHPDDFASRVAVLVPTLEKFWFRFRLLLRITKRVMGTYVSDPVRKTGSRCRHSYTILITNRTGDMRGIRNIISIPGKTGPMVELKDLFPQVLRERHQVMAHPGVHAGVQDNVGRALGHQL